MSEAIADGWPFRNVPLERKRVVPYPRGLLRRFGKRRMTRSPGVPSAVRHLNFLDLPQRLEPCAEIAHQELRLFPRREVPAFVVLLVVEELGIRPFRPTPRSFVDLFREDANGGRNGDVEVVEEGALVFPIETSAGHARVRQPGKGDVVEDVVPCEIAVGLPIEKEFRDVRVAGYVVVDHPGGKGDG